MALAVLDGGLLTTVQDLGRPGYERYGVPVCGAMDRFALQAANSLVGNHLGEAALEMTVLGPRLRAEHDCLIALAGADLGPRVDERPVAGWRTHRLRRGQMLDFTGPAHGCRGYLAVAGGFAIDPVLGSRSTFLRGRWGGVEGRALQAGDLLRLRDPNPDQPGRAGGAVAPADVPRYVHELTVRVVLGPQDDLFTPAGIDTLLGSVYEVGAESDRMGYRLRGPRVEHRAGADIVSDGVVMGSVQVPGDGQPIIMMADRQTTGGYTKIATVATADLPLLAQCQPGVGRVRFARVTEAVAVELLRDMERRLARLAGPRAYRLYDLATAGGEYAEQE